MRLSIEHNLERPPLNAPAPAAASANPSIPDLGFLTREFTTALQSFYSTVERVIGDNPVRTDRLQQLVATARAGTLTSEQASELEMIKAHALRQGRAVAAVIAAFLKYRPYPMLEEIRRKEKVFQPAFGPVLVVDGHAVRDVLDRHQEFTVDPYGAEMVKVMSPRHNGGFSTFVLSTDDTSMYEPDRRLLSAVCNRQDADRITAHVHADCMARVGAAVQKARAAGSMIIDAVQSLTRYVPVTVARDYLGVPVGTHPQTFTLTSEMLTYYGEPIDGLPATALGVDDGVIPDERQLYEWIKAAFQHFFNNVQKDQAVAAQGLRSCRLLLASLLREIAIQRQLIVDGRPVPDTMVSRLIHFQLGRSTAHAERPADLDPRLVSDLRIAENVMGTVVGAVAGQEEATSRAIDSMIRLKDGEYRKAESRGPRDGTFEDARQLALNVLNRTNPVESRAKMHRYFLEALRLQPQGEVLLRKCVKEGAQIANSRPIAAGTLVFVAHGSAMQDVPQPDAFILDRPREHYLQYGWGRHTCLGQFVSPVIAVESMIALLGLEGLARVPAAAGESPFPLERRSGHLQLDEHNLYATSFALKFMDVGTTRQFWPLQTSAAPEVV